MPRHKLLNFIKWNIIILWIKRLRYIYNMLRNKSQKHIYNLGQLHIIIPITQKLVSREQNEFHILILHRRIHRMKSKKIFFNVQLKPTINWNKSYFQFFLALLWIILLTAFHQWEVIWVRDHRSLDLHTSDHFGHFTIQEYFQ